MEPVIRWDRVTKLYGRQYALNDVTLHVPPGVVFALLGENGAGKSTALRIALGLTAADGGTSWVLGLDAADSGLEIRRRVGYVPEQPVLYDWMTPREIGWFVSGFHGASAWTLYLEHVRRFRVPLNQRIRTLSKGMRAKVGLSLALAHDPELLILDEPTSGLDALVRREFLESMVDRAATGKTVLLSSHQIQEVERVADYVAIIRDGRLLAVDRLDELKAQTRQVTYSLANEDEQPPLLPGHVLEQRRQGRQCRVLLRGATNGQLDRAIADAGLEVVEQRTPSLEEIFVAYMQGDTPSPFAA